MKNTILTIAALAATSLLSMSANAGITSAKIDKLLVFEGGMMLYIYPLGGVNNPPQCHGSNGDYYSYRLDRPLAKEYYSGLLAAHMSGAIVELWGLDDCVDQTMSETLRYFRISRPN
ncbi:MAG: hypothetical protein AB8G16_12515 [Gammaproteobacteria bacterium]